MSVQCVQKIKNNFRIGALRCVKRPITPMRNNNDVCDIHAAHNTYYIYIIYILHTISRIITRESAEGDRRK